MTQAPLPHARSWLFVPANQEALIAKAFASAAEAIIVDLEDSVPEDSKESARAAICCLIPSTDKQVWVRTNAASSPFFEADVAAMQPDTRVDGILIPKVESASDLVTERSLAAGRSRPLQQGLLIESARGVLNLYQILCQHPATAMVMFGGAENADLMTDLQCEWSIDGPELLHARQHALLAIRANARTLPVDGVYARLDDFEGLERDTRLSRRLGYRARAVVSPRQIAPVNDIYALSEFERERASAIVKAFSAALDQGSASIRLEGKLIDYAMYRAACRQLGVDARD